MSEPQDHIDTPSIDGETLDDLVAYLEANAVGRDNAVVSDVLADAIDEHDSHDTNPTVREAVKALLYEREVPVASGPTGYYLPASPDEREREVESIRQQIGQLNARKIAFEQAAEGYSLVDDDDPAPENTCERCGATIDGDPWVWFSYELCKRCHDDAPGLSDATDEWVENGGVSA